MHQGIIQLFCCILATAGMNSGSDHAAHYSSRGRLRSNSMVSKGKDVKIKREKSKGAIKDIPVQDAAHWRKQVEDDTIIDLDQRLLDTIGDLKVVDVGRPRRRGSSLPLKKEDVQTKPLKHERTVTFYKHSFLTKNKYNLGAIESPLHNGNTAMSIFDIVSPRRLAAIDTSADGALSVFAIDVDGDGDTDVLAASHEDNTIAWYENDGNQGFKKHEIDMAASGADYVYAIDMDGDGDIDVLACADGNDSLAWYENDGNQVFTKHVIPANEDTNTVFAVDVDGDGDIDVLASSLLHDRIVWFENDGQQRFTRHEIDSDANGATAVFAIDMDADGDIDVVAGAYYDDNIAWYENIGSQGFTKQAFTKHVIDTNINGPLSVYAIDLDDDGDIDVLATSYWDDTIAWYQNNGIQGFTKREIDADADGADCVYAIDVDGDGDIDVLAALSSDDTVAWYENDGAGKFTKHVIDKEAHGVSSVYAIDVDGDGDTDVLAASFDDDTVWWYENLVVRSTTALPTHEPTSEPTPRPTQEPTSEPTSAPTYEPSASPTPWPTPKLTPEPTSAPTNTPTFRPSSGPTSTPTIYSSPSPTLCRDDPTWYKSEDSSKNCEWVSTYSRNRCAVRGADGRKASEACFNACGCPSPSVEPTILPTIQPTTDPTHKHIATPTFSECSNTIRDGTETDIDCGGSQCSPCASGFSCRDTSDCTTKVCLAGICVDTPTQEPTFHPTSKPTTSNPTRMNPTSFLAPTAVRPGSNGDNSSSNEHTLIIVGAVICGLVAFLAIVAICSRLIGCCVRQESSSKTSSRSEQNATDDEERPLARSIKQSSDDAAAARMNTREALRMLLICTSVVPGIHEVSHALLALLDKVDAMSKMAQDIVAAGQRVCDTADFLIILHENAARLSPKDNATNLVERHMKKLTKLLERFQVAVVSFEGKGWLPRKWHGLAHNAQLQKLDREIIAVLEKLRQAYRLAMDRHISELLSMQSYNLEAAMQEQIQNMVKKQDISLEDAANYLANDEDVLALVAKRAGIAESEVSSERTRIREDKLQLLKTQEVELDHVEKVPFKIGGQARIYVGQSKGRKVAVKTITLHGLSENDRKLLKSGLATEVGICMKVQSPCIVQVYGVVTVDPDFVGMVMEFMPGGSLRDRLDNFEEYPTFSDELRSSWCEQISNGMDFLYSAGVQHRDLKCSNILLDANDDLKLADFGLARCEEFRTHTTKLTKSSRGGAPAGTYGFMAPELLQSKGFTEKSDVYSYAMVCFEIISREWPWKGYDKEQIVEAVVKERCRPELPLYASVFIVSLINACWHQDPKNRLSFAEIKDQFFARPVLSGGVSLHSISDDFGAPSFAEGSTSSMTTR